MKQIKTKNHTVLVDDEDFDELIKYRWEVSSVGYVVRQQWKNNKPKTKMMHREILGNVAKEFVVDHIDRNPLNNQKSNLRICTQSENVFNSGIRKNNKSGNVGVRFVKQINRWEAHIMKNRKKHHLGVFKTEDEAIKARQNGEALLFPNFSRTT